MARSLCSVARACTSEPSEGSARNGTVALPPADRQALLAGFEGVTQNPLGTAYGIFTGPLAADDIAGKTGAAQVQGKQSTSIFTSFAPASDPQFEVTAILEQAGYGADVAGPVVRQIYDSLYGLPAQPVSVVAESGEPGDLTAHVPSISSPARACCGRAGGYDAAHERWSRLRAEPLRHRQP